ncbi:ATP synthase subunit e, mitochondrial [Beauveria bassiana]|uniref:ATP synthase F(0) complex subunit e, mitochondrial n=1 Tax=Beauveria bassiana TaxID=176275 RepID=A0A2N6NFQ5_BEABA|nr:ATP synthase subunit e, mitochondrial [Beauveria bassiana]KAH8717414.1 ATP synthase subunit e, mitochondrial [Beauveria bassiana]PMB66113.1 ATP synthase subunit e, mitochondrial [Beauveria bassiana]
MASTGVNVLRWSALAAGLFYGFSHQRTITATQKAAHSKHEYEKKSKLIEQARAEYTKQKNPSPASADNGASLRHYFVADVDAGSDTSATTQHVLTDHAVVTDVNSPQFDLEKFLVKVAEENP